ncbi:MAG: hypothetical protein HYZ58_03265 [Acidobacteria bacterium]|nr:hypothetical protein [Acidobacteriota bacterium]
MPAERLARLGATLDFHHGLLVEHRQHEHMQTSAGWQFMQDGVVFGEFNHQGSPRGGTEFIVPNWWMGMASRGLSVGRITFTGMFSLDPVTVDKEGYREIFQVGEALDGRPVIDRQHPHDLFMQLAGSWRVPINESTGLTIAAAPVGEAALGPVAFMHRPSAAENPTAPLGHHTFDSTHIAFGVITAALDHGPWIVEGSLFNGREPDEDRWDFDFGPLDSFSGRVWFRPTAEWELQASTGFLKQPEELEPGNVVRTTLTGSWFRRRESDFTALTMGYGWNHKDEGDLANFFAEATWHAGMHSLYGRFEAQQPEIAALLTDRIGHRLDKLDLKGTVVAFSIGGVRDLVHAKGFELGLGGDVSFYGVPQILRDTRGVCAGSACTLGVGYGSSPVSFHLFLRLRPPAPKGRMWNMRMSHPGGHDVTMPHPMP